MGQLNDELRSDSKGQVLLWVSIIHKLGWLLLAIVALLLFQKPLCALIPNVSSV